MSIHILGNLAFILVACSFMVKDILWLRFLSVTGSLCSIIYNGSVTDHPLWVPICWNLFFISLNFYHITKIIYGNRKIDLNKKELELSQLNLIEFAKLVRMGEWKKAKEGVVLINEDQEMDALLMIYNGQVEVLVKDNDTTKKVSILKDGQFIGEMSFLSNRPATATVRTLHPTEYVLWKQKDLKALLNRNPSLLFSLQAAIGVQVIQALTSQNKDQVNS
jgi:ABC-type cobalt transport system substrate-binding protein